MLHSPPHLVQVITVYHFSSRSSFLTCAGRYRAYVCATFKGEGYSLGKPTEYGVWLNNFPVKGLTDVQQVYYSTPLRSFLP